jgi:hypothetical protein
VKVAFADREEHLAHVPKDHRVIALAPLVELAAELSGMPFGRPDDYVDEQRVEEEGLRNFGAVERLCALIGTAVGERSAAGREMSEAGQWLAFQLKILYDGVTLRADAIRRLLVAERPDEAILFTGTGGLYPEVTGYVLDRLGVPLRRIHVPLALQRPGGRRVRLRLAMRARAAAFEAKMRLRAPRGGARVLCLDRRYGIAAIEAELRRRGCDVRFWRRPPAPRADEALWRGIEQNRAIRSMLAADGLDLWPAFAPRLRTLVERDLLPAIAEYRAARAQLESERPAAFLTSMAAFPREKGVCTAARQAGIPTIVSRHGELGMRDVPIVAYQDVEVVDWALCWGRWEAEWIARHARRRVETVVVGSPHVEEAVALAPGRPEMRRRLGVESDALVGLYVPTNLSGDEWYASRRAPPDSSYFRHQTSVIRSLLTVTGLSVVVKEPRAVGGSPLDRWCRAFADSVRVIDEPDFGQLVHLADVVVIDLPSTTLVQALFGSARIYVVDHPVLKWETGVVEHLARHGVVFCSAQDVGDRIEQDARAGTAAGRHQYGREATEPLAAQGEGTAASRAASAILEIASAR